VRPDRAYDGVRWLGAQQRLEPASKFSRATLREGDLLISKDGTIGKVAIVPAELEGANITQHLVRALIHPLLDNRYFAYAIRSHQAQTWLSEQVKGVALQGINVEDFRRLPLPIPPIDEQREIVDRVGRMLEQADALMARIDLASVALERSSQAVLAKAFRGELMPGSTGNSGHNRNGL
jgi:type I restriction enzyme, S subunit